MFLIMGAKILSKNGGFWRQILTTFFNMINRKENAEIEFLLQELNKAFKLKDRQFLWKIQRKQQIISI